MTDFASYQAWLSQEQLVSFQSLTITTAGNLFGPVPMTGFDGLEVHLESAPGPITVLVAWCAAPDTGTLITSCSWTLPAQMALDVIVPRSGLFAFVEFTSQGAGSVNALVYAAPVNGAGGKYHWLTPNPELIKLNSAVGAGATAKLLLGGLVAAPCYAMIAPRDTSGQLSFILGTATAAGNVSQRLYNFGAPATTAPVVVPGLILPAQPVLLQVTNADGVTNHNYDAAIVPQLTP